MGRVALTDDIGRSAGRTRRSRWSAVAVAARCVCSIHRFTACVTSSLSLFCGKHERHFITAMQRFACFPSSKLLLSRSPSSLLRVSQPHWRAFHVISVSLTALHPNFMPRVFFYSLYLALRNKNQSNKKKPKIYTRTFTLGQTL